MASDVFGGLWKQMKGEVKQRWGQLTDDDITEINGRKDKLVGKLQERYGYSRQEAENQVTNFINQNRSGNEPSHTP